MSQKPQTQYEQELNSILSVPRRFGGLGDLAANRLAAQFQQMRRKLQPTNTSSGAAVKINPTLPKQVLSVSATQTASKQQDRTFSLVSVSFTRDANDPNYAGVRIWFKGYKGNSQWELVASGSDSPVSFLEEATSETVQVAVQAFNQSGFAAPFSGAPIGTVTLSGVVSAPPAPTVSQNVVPVVGGFQFTFTLEAGLLADVIDSYKVYRNTVNVSGSARVVQTIKHPQSNNGSYVVQDYPGGDSVYFYWVSAVNTVGLESSLTAAQSSTQMALTQQNAFGKNLVPNPGFENNFVGVTPGSSFATTNTPLCDGWQCATNTGPYFSFRLANNASHSGVQSAEIYLADSTAVPNGTSGAQCSIVSTSKLPLAVGDIVRVSAFVERLGTGLPAGVTVQANFGLQIFNSSGSFLGNLNVAPTLSGSFVQYQGALSIPATLGGSVPAYAQFVLYCSLSNSSGSTFNTGTGNFYGATIFDDVRCVIQNTAFDLTPLNTAYLPTTNGNILSQSGTTTTVNVAGFTMQYGDGSVTYNSGTVTAPTNTSTGYVYCLDPTYSGGAVTYQWSTTAVNQIAQGNGLIVIGKITLAAGGGGAGGAGGGGTVQSTCFSPNTRLASGKDISRAKVGDPVWAESDNGERILRRIARVLEHDYDGPMHDMGDGELVTPTHNLRHNGGWVQARELFPATVHYKGKVFNLHVATDQEDEHNYVLRNGRCAHNFQKP